MVSGHESREENILTFITTTQTFLYLKTSFSTFHIPIRDSDAVRDILIHRCRRHQYLTSHQKDELSPLRSPLYSPQVRSLIYLHASPRRYSTYLLTYLLIYLFTHIAAATLVSLADQKMGGDCGV